MIINGSERPARPVGATQSDQGPSGDTAGNHLLSLVVLAIVVP